MRNEALVPKAEDAEASDRKLLTPADVASEYTIPENTQAIWRCTNRWGFRDLVIKLGRSVRYRRSDIEAWLESRRSGAVSEGKAGAT